MSSIYFSGNRPKFNRCFSLGEKLNSLCYECSGRYDCPRKQTTDAYNFNLVSYEGCPQRKAIEPVMRELGAWCREHKRLEFVRVGKGQYDPPVYNQYGSIPERALMFTCYCPFQSGGECNIRLSYYTKQNENPPLMNERWKREAANDT